MNQENNDSVIYANCIKEIKERLFSIKKILNNNSCKFESLAEYSCLQMRKVCEVFAFSTMTANRSEYERIRNEFENDWNFKGIIRSVNSINEGYYPEPIIPVSDKDGNITKYEGIQEECIDIEYITDIYNKCCENIHAKNPYNQNISILTQDTFLNWIEKFVKLLNCHVVGVNTIEHRKVFITHMYADDLNKNIMVFTANKNIEMISVNNI